MPGIAVSDIIIILVLIVASILVIVAASVFTVANFIVFTIIPILSSIFGILLLVDFTTVDNAFFLNILNLKSIIRGESDIYDVYAVRATALGLVGVLLGWTSYFAGHSTTPFVKSVYSGIFAFGSLKLWWLLNPASGDAMTCNSINQCYTYISEDLYRSSILSVGIAAVITSIGHMVGPVILSALQKNVEKNPCK